MEWILVESIDDLKRLSNINGWAEFYVLLAGGLCKSGKRIHFDNKSGRFDIINEIDETWLFDISEKQLHTKTIIPLAIRNSTLYYCGVQFRGYDE